ncbi:LysM peptidoglycan-binding domain-containing protein [Aureibaculum marinum]|uniref:LysM peptidoglycan-binding domain-containing protein n=1 Tax=Aureibaculum marinum TaxID=2487930 RepID=A0A3N4NUD5_9FLAO|nr:peptidoglycan DD-metalloendopeptidase family protein [Aureibaculum marinum]RPD97948.1 LysM peptidoglycan-binding domain-containing protein [Aureibaculum marinum]
MKRFFPLVFLTIFSYTSYGQNKAIDPLFIKNLEKKINTHINFLSKESLDLIVNYSSENPNLNEYWDNSRYNPFPIPIKNIHFQLLFRDSLYVSPIPTDRKVITSRFGWRHRRPHKGIDIDLVTGDTVTSMLDGKVRYVKYSRGHGKTVIVRHSNGLELVYAHLSKQLVKENQLVFKGQPIGLGGTTGNARGSHLHLEAIYKGNYINPDYLFDFGNKNRIRNKELWVTNKWTSPHLHSSRRQSKIVIANSFEEAELQKVAPVKTHKIRKGDTLSGIANKYGVSISAICKANGIKRNTTLRIGRRLIIGLP